MPKWEIIRLPTFEADLERYQINQEKLEKWLEDLKKEPRKIKNAHSLRGILKPLWSAQFNPGNTTFVVLYLLCDGRKEFCFLRQRNVRQHLSEEEVVLVGHSCDKDLGKVFVWKLGTHAMYDLLA